MRSKLILSQELWHWGCLPAEYRGVIRWEGVVVQRLSDPQRLR